MITVEELIVQSLFHRLVVVNVRRTNEEPKKSTAASTSQDAGSPDSSPTSRSRSHGQDPPETGCVNLSTLGPGLGILYMGSMSQKMRSALINKTVQQCIAASTKPALTSSSESGDTSSDTTTVTKLIMPVSSESQALLQSLAASGEEVRFSQEVQTVLETGEMSMMKASLVTESTQTDVGQIWQFGPSSGLGTPGTDDDDEEKAVSSALPAMIDLRNCDQFSIVKFEDTRDPKSKSLVMVQTNEIGASSTMENRPKGLNTGTSTSQYLEPSTPSTLSLSPSPVASPTISNSQMSVYVKNTKGQSRPHLQEVGAESHEMDSGIWDMMKGMESSKTSTRESTPIVQPSCSRIQKMNQKATDATMLQIEAGIEEPCLSPVHMLGTFKAYSVNDATADGSASHGPDVPGNRKSLQFPEAEVKFTIHNEERHIECRDDSTETLSSYQTAPQSMIQSPDGTYTYQGFEHRDSTSHIITHGSALSDTARLTAALQAFPFENALPPSPEPDPDSISVTGSDVTIEIKEESPERHMGLNDFMVARERGVIASRCQVDQQSGASHTIMNGGEIHDGFSGLNDIEATKHRGMVLRRLQHSPPYIRNQSTRSRPAKGQGHRDSGIMSAAHSPGGSTRMYHSRGSDDFSMDSSFLSDYTDLDDVSAYDSDALESSDTPAFERFPNWMSELPDRLKTTPLKALVIPGSHIALAIDREMRFDMDFSKCNYEMAEFLRKLPNLAIFNNFRTLMKKIWRAWMPKQMLGIYHQLEAGCRYFDIRITKYRSAFYGEHGLYTRQFKKYLKDMKAFMDEHPSEIIILHFQQLDQLERVDKRRLVTVLFQVFGAKMSRATDLQNLTLKTLWDTKKQVMVFFPSADIPVIRNHIFAGLIWSDDHLHMTLPKKQTVPDMIEYLEAIYPDIVDSKNKKKNSDKMYVTKAVLSPDMTMVFGEFQYKSMRELMMAETLGAITSWLQDKTQLNVVAVDFVGAENLVRSILMLNGKGVVRDVQKETVV